MISYLIFSNKTKKLLKIVDENYKQKSNEHMVVLTADFEITDKNKHKFVVNDEYSITKKENEVLSVDEIREYRKEVFSRLDHVYKRRDDNKIKFNKFKKDIDNFKQHLRDAPNDIATKKVDIDNYSIPNEPKRKDYGLEE